MTNDEILQAAKEAGYGTAFYSIDGEPAHEEIWGGPMETQKVRSLIKIIEKRTIERCAIPDQAMQAIQEACRSAMHYTAAARIPECGEFGAIAQNLSFALQEIAAIRKLGEQE